MQSEKNFPQDKISNKKTKQTNWKFQDRIQNLNLSHKIPGEKTKKNRKLSTRNEKNPKSKGKKAPKDTYDSKYRETNWQYFVKID